MSGRSARIRARLAGWRRADRAFAPEDGPAYLPWIVGIMVFLAALALAAALALSGAANRWTAGLKGTLTVEIPVDAAQDPRGPDERLKSVLDVLRATPGIEMAQPIAPERIAQMIEPWLGSDAQTRDLPLPQMIDVRVFPGAEPDLTALGARLAEASPGTVVDDHRSWLDGLIRLARLAVGLAAGVVVLIGLAAAGCVVFATRAGLAAHQQAIEILHLMGAHDGYIARQFARLALARSAAGAVGGAIAAAASFHLLGFAARAIDPVLVPGLRLEPWHWILLAALPAAAVAVATLTARRTAMHALRKML